MEKQEQNNKMSVFFCILYVGLYTAVTADTDADLRELKLLVSRLVHQQHAKDELIEKLQADVQDLREQQRNSDLIMLQQREDIEKLENEQVKRDQVIKTLVEDVYKLKWRQPNPDQLDDFVSQHQPYNYVKTLLDTQHNVKQQVKRADDTNPLEAVVSQLSQKMTDFTAQLQSLNNAVTQVPGAVYTRWGNRACPSTSNLVYTGVIGGAHYSHTGGATNALCLPLDPVYTTGAHVIDYHAGFASLYGSEYEVSPEPAHNRVGVCAVCMSSRPQTIMMPVTNVCLSGWIKEYSGYIMAARPDDGRSGTEFICVDSTLDGLLGSEHTNDDGMLLYYTKTHCGSLPCPPFKEGQVVSCVVCSH